MWLLDTGHVRHFPVFACFSFDLFLFGKRGNDLKERERQHNSSLPSVGIGVWLCHTDSFCLSFLSFSPSLLFTKEERDKKKEKQQTLWGGADLVWYRFSRGVNVSQDDGRKKEKQVCVWWVWVWVCEEYGTSEVLISGDVDLGGGWQVYHLVDTLRNPLLFFCLTPFSRTHTQNSPFPLSIIFFLTWLLSTLFHPHYWSTQLFKSSLSISPFNYNEGGSTRHSAGSKVSPSFSASPVGNRLFVSISPFCSCAPLWHSLWTRDKKKAFCSHLLQ